jgi:hypothetical protein
MTDWTAEAKAALRDFREVARLGGTPLADADLVVEFLRAPHRPPGLPFGRMAVYAFWGDGAWLKIGIAGPNSDARYRSQHYNAGSAPSTLAGSLVKFPPAGQAFTLTTPGEWIKARTHRMNILMPASQPRELVSLLEAFLHLRLRPRFEG